MQANTVLISVSFVINTARHIAVVSKSSETMVTYLLTILLSCSKGNVPKWSPLVLIIPTPISWFQFIWFYRKVMCLLTWQPQAWEVFQLRVLESWERRPSKSTWTLLHSFSCWGFTLLVLHPGEDLSNSTQALLTCRSHSSIIWLSLIANRAKHNTTPTKFSRLVSVSVSLSLPLPNLQKSLNSTYVE